MPSPDADAAAADGSQPDGPSSGDATPDQTSVDLGNDVAPVPPAPGTAPFTAWPGTTAVTTADESGQFAENVSGLAYVPAAGGQATALLAVQNSPSMLYRLTEQGTVWKLDSSNGWGNGKALNFPGGGAPDSEGVTITDVANVAYVAVERDDSGDSRCSILRFDIAGSGTTLTATNEWNVTSDLPSVDGNSGFEAITWVPDSYLVSRGFLDASTKAPYDPSRYANHGNGLFLVGLEANGAIYAYALDHNSAEAHLIATIPSGQEGVMDLGFDAARGVLFAACDDTCGNKITLLGIDSNPTTATKGTFVVWRGLNRPASLPDSNNEGITFAPVTECMAGQRRFFWADDSAAESHALRVGSITCDPLF